MIRWLRRLADGPDKPLCEQLRALWGVPDDWTQPASTARVVPNKKPQTIAEWKQAYERKAS